MRFPILLLDFGGVCIPHPFEIPALFAAAFGLSPDQLSDRDDPDWQRQQAGEITEREYWTIRAAHAGRLLSGHPWSLQEFFHRFHNNVDGSVLIRPEAHAVADAARAAGARVAIFTNDLTHFAGAEFVRTNPFVARSDPLVDGELTGFLKPDPRAYRAALAALGDPPPGDVLFVDDQPANVEGGRQAGLHSVLFDTTNPHRSWWEVARTLFDPATADRLVPPAD